jgi:Undecaprenyl-phosphate galactose phosphotransferase WbaP
MSSRQTANHRSGEEHERDRVEYVRPYRRRSRKQRLGVVGLVVLVLILSDVLLALLVWEAVTVFRAAFEPLPEGIVAIMASNIAAWVGIRVLLGLYPGYGLDQVEELRRQSYAVAASMFVTIIFILAIQIEGSLLSWLMLGLGFLGLALLAPLLRYYVKWGMMKTRLWGKPVLILGTGKNKESLPEALQKEWELGFRPISVLENPPATIDVPVKDSPYREVLDNALDLTRAYQIDTIIFDVPRGHPNDPARWTELVNWAGLNFQNVVLMPVLMASIMNSATTLRNFAGNFGLEIRHNLLNPWAQRTKRTMELFLTIVGGLLIIPLLLALAILIKLSSPGPVFYSHLRLGAEGNLFSCWKFRTMYADAEQLLDKHLQNNPALKAEWERDYKLHEDPRVTWVGRFLRKTSLDELPQLWNVLRGEMSLVGPRPIIEAEVPKYKTAYGWNAYQLYTRTTPGITGLWQVSGRSDTSYEKRVELDAYYVRDWSVWLDLVILARTVKSVILRLGAY